MLTLEQTRPIIEWAIKKFGATTIVSGGAKGVDSHAEQIGNEFGLDIEIYRPTIYVWGGEGGFKERNLQIAQACDALVRIAARGLANYGSGWTRDRAQELGKPCEEFVV